MRILFALLAAFAIATLPAGTRAQENQPTVIPEQLQKLAIEQQVAKRLDINWQDAGPQEVGRYAGILAAASVLAQEIAKRNDRSVPTDADYLAALAASCSWPPNKPPIIAEDRPLLYPAFYSSEVRGALREAVGPKAVELPSIIKFPHRKSASYSAMSSDVLGWPKSRDEYFEQVLDIRKLQKAQ